MTQDLLDKDISIEERRRQIEQIYKDLYLALVRRGIIIFGCTLEEAEDLVHEAFRKAYLTDTKYTLENPWGLLNRIMRNLRINQAKKDSRLTAMDEQIISPFSIEETVINNFEEEEIDTLITNAKLTERERRVFSLRFFEGMSPSKISMREGISEKRISTILYEAKQKLRKVLETQDI